MLVGNSHKQSISPSPCVSCQEGTANTPYANRGLGISHKQGQSISEHLVFEQLMYKLGFKQDWDPLYWELALLWVRKPRPRKLNNFPKVKNGSQLKLSYLSWLVEGRGELLVNVEHGFKPIQPREKS